MNKYSDGFTLMETSLALTLLTVGMLSLAGVFSQIVKANASVERKQTAALLADAKLTELCSLPLSEIGPLQGTFSEPFDAYNWQVRLEYQPDNEKIADIWLEVKYKSNTSINLWTQIEIDNVKE